MTALIVLGGAAMLTGWVSIKMSLFSRNRRKGFLPVPVAVGLMVVGLVIALIGAANA